MPTKDELEEKLANRRRKRVKYHGIGRYLAVVAGTAKMVDVANIEVALRALQRGDMKGAGAHLERAFLLPTIKERMEGAAIMGLGVGTGKILDKAQVNPHIELFAGQGIKLW